MGTYSNTLQIIRVLSQESVQFGQESCPAGEYLHSERLWMLEKVSAALKTTPTTIPQTPHISKNPQKKKRVLSSRFCPVRPRVLSSWGIPSLRAAVDAWKSVCSSQNYSHYHPTNSTHFQKSTKKKVVQFFAKSLVQLGIPSLRAAVDAWKSVCSSQYYSHYHSTNSTHFQKSTKKRFVQFGQDSALKS